METFIQYYGIISSKDSLLLRTFTTLHHPSNLKVESMHDGLSSVPYNNSEQIK